MVVSQEQGRYTSPNLPPAKYKVQGFGGTFQSALAGPVEVSKSQQAQMDLLLSAPLQIPAREKRLTDADYEKLMPEGEGKHAVVSHCVDCHSLEWIVSARKTPVKWRETVDRMYDDLLGRLQPMWLAMKEDEALEGLILDYLTKYYGPQTPVDSRVAGEASHPNRNLPASLLQGASAKFVEMEFSLPAGSAPRDIAVDSQGTAWVSETNTGMLGRFDPKSLTYARIAAPVGRTPQFQLNAVAVDPQDQVWFVDDGPNARVLEYNPKSKEFNSYQIPDYPYLVPDIGAARVATLRFLNGNVWGTRMTAQRIFKLDPTTRKITEYPVPRGSVPFGLALGGNNTLWYTAAVGNLVVSLDSTTGRLTPHDVPASRSGLRGIAADAEGNLWAAASETGKLLKVDSRTGNVTEFAPPTEDSRPFAVDVDTKRNLVWFSETRSDRLGRFDPGTGTFVEFPSPEADSVIRRIEVDRSHPGRVWWADAHGSKIGYVEVIE